ncbi:phasin family protein [Glaciecola sp. KUL10]|uniref:phasin family protein n=1 Tax=Glaciecola sp. (strain KUL10) TaxID=2161813 RepID=UPI000D78A06C|nr:phasin family protein [Glaciecola sp. KUL10]GBL03698.1 hypothetical protein KUL10_09980 [Glaciecola sp. KUL10]
MFGKFQDQFKKTTVPANSLFAANAKLIEKMSVQQTELFSGVINDSLKLMDSCAEQSELKGLLAAQSMFAQSFRDRMTSVSKTTYSTLNDMGQEYTAVIKQSFETASEVTKDVAEQAAQQTKPAVVKPKSAPKKAAPKKAPTKSKPTATKAAPKAAPKTAAKSEVKPVAAKPAATKTTSKTPTKKAAPKTTTKAAPKPATKAASKPVATLSAEEIKATAPVKASAKPKTSV